MIWRESDTCGVSGEMLRGQQKKYCSPKHAKLAAMWAWLLRQYWKRRA